MPLFLSSNCLKPVPNKLMVSFQVRKLKVHLFTVIQILCVGVLWAVKSSPAALAFPFVLLLLVPFRKFILKFIFSEEELQEVCTPNINTIYLL